MKFIKSTIVSTVLLLSAPAYAESNYADKAIVSHCKSPEKHEVVQGKTLQPSNACRVVNYYQKKKLIGTVSIPLGEWFIVPWLHK